MVIAPDLTDTRPADERGLRLGERSRQLRIGLFNNTYNLVAVLSADAFLTVRLAQLQPT